MERNGIDQSLLGTAGVGARILRVARAAAALHMAEVARPGALDDACALGAGVTVEEMLALFGEEPSE